MPEENVHRDEVSNPDQHEINGYRHASDYSNQPGRVQLTVEGACHHPSKIIAFPSFENLEKPIDRRR